MKEAEQIQNDSFYGDWVEIDDEITKEDAEKYLTLWMKIFAKKNKLQLVDHAFVYREHLGTVGIKIQCRPLKK